MTATPRLVADLDVLERNIDAMASLGRDAGVALRPHVKTHKMPEIATMQRDAGARGITVATIGEAEVFVDAGFDDVFIAYPLWVDDEAGRRLRALAERARVGVGCDSMTAARQLRKPLGSAVVEVLVELDSGQHRTGIPARDAGELAAGIASLGFDVRGVFTFPGHSYSPEGRAQSADDERAALAGASRALRAKGIEPHVRSGGSSPSMAFAARNRAGEGARAGTPRAASSSGSALTSLPGDTSAVNDGMGPSTDGAPTEMRPGAYVFNDAQQWELGACAAGDIALTAHARVVSHSGGRLVLDAGSKTLAADKAPWASGHGRLLDHPDARIVQMSEHHAVVDMAGASLPALGSTVRVVPNHCCNAINLANAVDVVRNGTLVDTWAVAARGMNS